MEKKMTKMAEGMESVFSQTKKIRRTAKAVKAFERADHELSALDTMRGGTKGFKGFAAESMEAAEASAKGRTTTVLNNNGIADLKHVRTDGKTAFKQMKLGYKPGQIDFARYKGQTVVLDKGNPYFRALKAEGTSHGVKVVEGHVTQEEAKRLADAMQLESKLTGSRHAVVVPKLYRGAKAAQAAHHAGLQTAKSGAAAGAGFSMGRNFVQVLKGNKSLEDAAGDVAVDTLEAGVISYGTGAVCSVVAGTEAGAAALGAVSAAGSALASAPVAGTVIGAGTAAAGAVAGAAASTAAAAAGAATAAAGSVAAAASGLAAGTAAAGVVSTVGAGAVAATAAAGAAAVAAAPVLAAGAVLGCRFSLFTD